MNLKELREKAARMIYEADLDMGNTTVKELMDIMERFGALTGEYFYREGVGDAVTNQVKERLFPENQSVTTNRRKS